MNKKTVGYLLMLLALTVPLGIFSMMTYSSLSQPSAYKVYSQKVAEVDEDAWTDRDLQSTIYNEQLHEANAAVVDPFDAEDYAALYDVETPEDETIYGFVHLPRLDLMQPLRLGASKKNLWYGFATVDGTPLPGAGMNSRAVISGHRTMPKNKMLFEVDTLTQGDEIILDVGDDILVYTYLSQEIIAPTEWEKLAPIAGKEVLTLLTCDPRTPPSVNRLLVNFERVDLEARGDIQPGKKPDRETIDRIFVQELDDGPTTVDLVTYALCGLSLLAFLLVLLAFLKHLRSQKRLRKAS